MATIGATQVLSMLSKATTLGIPYDIREKEGGEFCIEFVVGWYDNKRCTYEKVFVTKGDESTWDKGWEFGVFMKQLDEKLEERNQERIREERRKEILGRLSAEEREILGFSK